MHQYAVPCDPNHTHTHTLNYGWVSRRVSSVGSHAVGGGTGQGEVRGLTGMWVCGFTCSSGWFVCRQVINALTQMAQDMLQVFGGFSRHLTQLVFCHLLPLLSVSRGGAFRCHLTIYSHGLHE